MVDISISGEDVVLRVRGLHRLWAFKREMRFQRGQLERVDAGIAPEAWALLRRSLRLPGTHLPLVIVAGSFRSPDAWTFWDVAGRGQNALTLTLRGHRYAQLIVDVEEPRQAMERLRALH